MKLLFWGSNMELKVHTTELKARKASFQKSQCARIAGKSPPKDCSIKVAETRGDVKMPKVKPYLYICLRPV